MKGNKKLRATTDSVYLAAENASLKIRKLPEIIRIRKDETVSEAARSRDVFKRLFFSRVSSRNEQHMADGFSNSDGFGNCVYKMYCEFANDVTSV